MRRSNLARKPRGNVETKPFTLKGGLNLVDSPINIPNGMAIVADNYEVLTRDGYGRIDGIERFDGHDSPTDSNYWILNYTTGTIAILEGDTVTGLISGATGLCLTNQVGTVADGYLVLTNVAGEPFNDGEALQVSAVTRAVTNGVDLIRGAATAALDSTYAIDAIETQRDMIDVVGAGDGFGPIRGVQIYLGEVYAFRDNVLLTECLMWKESPTGWVQQSLGNRVAFSLGTDEVFEGETLTQTGTTSTILRVLVVSGDWGTNDAAGYLIIGPVTSGPYAAVTLATTSLGSITTDGAEVANTMAPGGRYEFENYNFYGSSSTFRMYGCNGVSEAFEWDGTVFVPLLTGNTIDTPHHLAVNEFHLMLAFQNGSLQNSDTGFPHIWAGGGAAEIGCGDNIVGLKKETGGALLILCDNRTLQLQGKNTTDLPWDLKTIDEEAGGREWSLQRLGETRYLDDRGFMSLTAVQAFGDFVSSTYSQVIEPLVKKKKELLVSSIIVRRKTQLRHFFSDGTGISATFNGKKLSGFNTITYQDALGAPIPVLCTANGERSNGVEILFFGSDNGMVYQMDKGNSIDGDSLNATLALAYNNLGSPSYDKQFKKVLMEAEGIAGTELFYNVLLDYNSGRAKTSITLSRELTASGGYWDGGIWNNFFWGSEDISLIEGSIDGIGRNIALQISSTSVYTDRHLLFSVLYHYITRKTVR
jgi:hypothetical protein